MADSLRELIITLKVDGAQQAKAALDGLDKAMNGTAKSAKDLDSSVGKASQGLTVFGAFVANVAANAFTSLAKGIANLGFSLVDNIITEASNSELEVKKLTAAILTAGLSVEETIPEINLFSDAIAKTTKFTSGEIKTLSAYALSLGATKDQLKEIIQVSTDFATVQEVDLKSSVQAFTRSLQGNLGILKQLFPPLNNMSEEAARAGGALKFVRNQMGGAAAAEFETFSGQVIQLKKNFSDIFATLGTPIINYLGPLLKDINALISPYTESSVLTKFSEGFVSVIEDIAVYIYDFYLFLSGGKSFLGLALKIDPNAPIFEKLMASFEAFFLLLAQKSGEWAIPIGIQIGKGILKGLLYGFLEIEKAIVNALPAWFIGPKTLLGAHADLMGSAVESVFPKTELPSMQRSNYLGPYSQSYFPKTEKTIPSDTLQQFQGATRGQGSSINQDIKMYVSGDTAVDALSRQLKTTMNTFKTNVVA